MAIGAIHGLSQTPLYVAEATVQVEKSSGGRASALDETLEGLGSLGLDTQIELLKSRALAEKVVRALKLQFERDVKHLFWQEPSRWQRVWRRVMLNMDTPHGPSPYTIEPLEIEEGYQPGVYTIEFLDTVRFVITDETGDRLAQGQVGEPVYVRGLTLVVDGSGLAGHTETVRVRPLRDAAEAIQGKIRAEQVRMTDILRIQAESPTPDQARDITNAVTQEYIALVLSRKIRAAEQTMGFIRTQFQPVLESLSAAERRLSEFKKTHASTVLSENSQSLLTSLAEAERESKRLQVLREQIRLVLERIRLQPPTAEDLNEVLLLGKEAGGMAGAILDQLMQLLIRRTVLKAQVTEHHSALRQLEAQIEQLSAALPHALSTLLDSVQKRESLLRANINRQLAQLNVLPLSEQLLARHTMEVKVNQNLYGMLFEKQEELRLAMASQISNVWVVDQALTPRSTVTKRVSRYIAMGGAAGLLLGILLIVGWDRYIDSSIKKEEDLTLRFRVPSLGTIPRAHPLACSSVAHGQPAIVVVKEPHSYPAEAYRYAWTNLQYATVDRPRKTLLITSSVMEEGKTTIAANLAVTMAKTGKRMLLVDADFRRPTLHRAFALPQSPGFSNLLAGEDVGPQASGIQNLAVLPSGDRGAQPLAVMAPAAITAFLATMSEEYDIILFDSPPVLPAADTLHLGNFVDGIVLVVKLTQTPEALVRRGIESLKGLRAKFLGVILNSGHDGPETHYFEKYYHDEGSGETKSLLSRLRRKQMQA